MSDIKAEGDAERLVRLNEEFKEGKVAAMLDDDLRFYMEHCSVQAFQVLDYRYRVHVLMNEQSSRIATRISAAGLTLANNSVRLTRVAVGVGIAQAIFAIVQIYLAFHKC